MQLLTVLLLALLDAAASSCDSSVSSGVQAHVVSWSNSACGISDYTAGKSLG